MASQAPDQSSAQFIEVIGPCQVDADRTVARLSLPAPRGDDRPQSAYIHVPFCSHKCSYCDFYSIVDTSQRRSLFVDRLIGEIRAAEKYLKVRPSTVFVGGGTPSLLETTLWERLLNAVAAHLHPGDDAEFTVEANPETVTARLAGLLAAGGDMSGKVVGVNRVSLGAQSFNPRHLATLQRRHEPANVSRAIDMCREAGIDNISLDLIFAVPGQSLDDWKADLEQALALEPRHLSCYGLTYEAGTPLHQAVEAGRVHPVDEDIEASMYEAAIDILGGAGFEHYEISNWARPGFRCRHNLACWRNQDYWPLGPAAAGHRGGYRWRNSPSLDDYLRIGPLPRIVDVEEPDEDREAGEQLMLGLRLIEGIGDAALERILQRGMRGQERREAIDRGVVDGLLTGEAGHLRLTRSGLLLADLVLADLV